MNIKQLCIIVLSLFTLTNVFGQDNLRGIDQTELARVRSAGIRYMLGCQEEGRGAWLGAFGHPAVTALAVLGIYNTPEYLANADIRARVDKALDYIASNAQPDGSIFSGRRGRRPGPQGADGRAEGAADGGADRRGGGQGGKGLMGLLKGGRGGGRPEGPAGPGGYAVYNTSICLLALATCNRPKDLEIIRKARAYLMGSDAIPKSGNGVPEGGFGYGAQTRSDLNNTAWALDALYVTNYLDREPHAQNPEAAKQSELAWENAAKFVTICQNLKDTNQSAWVASAPEEDKGGFIYCPQDAMKDKPEARSLRAYGTMTYSGLKSLIYAKVKKDDVRIQSAMEWVLKNYTLEENPGVGKAGLYYYYHTFAKTLSLLEMPSVTDAKGVTHDWKAELAAKLAATQRADGSWCNEASGRWMESIPQLSTAYCLMALQYLK